MKYSLHVALLITLSLQGCSAKTLYYYDGDEKRILTPDTAIQQRTSESTHYFRDENGVLMGVSNRIVIKTATDLTLDTLMATYNLTLGEKLGSNMYVLITPSADMTIDVANALTKEDGVVFAHPDFIKEVSPR